MKRHLHLLMGLCLLFLCQAARGQTSIPITGPSPVCKGNTGVYSITPTHGLTYYWSVSSQGNISSTTTSSATILWGIVGTGTVNVYGLDSAADTVQKGTLSVVIAPLPTPYITNDAQVNCQIVDTQRQKDNGGVPYHFNDTGCTKVCANSTVIFTAHGFAGSTFTWSATGDASISPSGATCTIVWGPAGAGTVTVTETTSSGCKTTKTICITIIDHPKAQFYVMPNPGPVVACDSTPLLFIDQSTPATGSSIVSWHWDFGDGTFSTASSSIFMPLVHQYNMPGTYIAILTVTNECGCSDTYQIPITIQPQTGVHIFCPHVVCQNDTASYSASPSCGAGMPWSVVGGTIQPVPPPNPATVNIKWDHVDTSGFGYITYDGTACGGMTCPGLTVVKVPVILTIGHIVGPTIVCAGNQVIYRLPQWPTTKFNWTVTSTTGATLAHTDQPNEIAVSTGFTSGTITLNCSYTNTLLNCGGSASITIQVLPAATISGQSIVCYKSTSGYSLNGSLVGNWILNFPDGTQHTFSSVHNISDVFNQVGNYTLTVSGTTFCPPNPFNIRVDSLPHKPDSITGPSTLCKGVQTEFDAGGPVPGTLFGWAVQNGTVNSGAGPKTFVELNTSSTGPFVVMVWRESVNAPYCHSDTLKKVVDTPAVSLSITGPTGPCPSTTATYVASYTLGETYTWFVGNPLLGSVQTNGMSTSNILWNNSAGSTTVNVSMTKCFRTYTASLPVTVSPIPPDTLHAPDTVCAASPVTASVTYSGASVSYDWGNGTVTTTGSYTYPPTGNSVAAYTLTVTVTTPCGNTIVMSKTIFVKPAPVANITPNGPFVYCPTSGPFSQLLTATINGSYEPVNFYTWYNGSTVVASGSSVTTYTATGAGIYYCVVTGVNGCTNTSDSVQVIADCGGGGPGCGTPPVISVTAMLDTCGYIHTTGSVTGGTFVKWTWPSQAVTAVTTSTTGDFTFNKAGFYVFTYVATNGTCNFTKSATATVPYIAGLYYAIQCNGSGTTYKVSFFDQSNFVIAPTNYTLKINGTTVYSAATPPGYNTNLAPGTYTVEEDISASGYPVCRAIVTVVVPNPPVASFTQSTTTICAGQAAVFFTSTSTGTGIVYNWDFGDGSSNSQPNPYKVYSAAAVRTVKLTVTDKYGCTSSVNHSVTIKSQDISGTLTGTPTYPCEGSAVTLKFNSTGIGTPNHYYWMDGLDTFASTIYNPINVFDPGYYWVRAVDAIGCYTNTSPDSVVITQVPPAFIYGDTAECAGTQFTLSGYAGEVPGLTYQWLLNGVAIGGATLPSLSQTLSAPGTYTYRLVLSVPNHGGFCTDTSAPFVVTVHALPAPPSLSFTIPNCTTYEVDLNVSPSFPGNYNWSNGMTGPSIVTYQGGPYEAVYTDVFGCKSYSTIVVPKDPRVYLWIFPTGCFALCVPTNTYDITGPIIPFTSWKYLNSGGPGSGGSGTPVDFTFNNAGVFNLVLSNGWCTDTSGDMDVSSGGPCQHGGKEIGADQQQNTNSTDAPTLKIIPNPAGSNATIAYSYSGTGTQRYIEVYDITGRLISRYEVVNASGEWKLSLANYLPGVYQVIMRQDNRILLNSKLAVIQ